ncbi:MAG: hypothetical protein FRX49_13770 [Trebouxia sp. A1-2]|nr:MAG: hypothetical protein FRX49_13770 [Trebouxia sp. A1-2]
MSSWRRAVQLGARFIRSTTKTNKGLAAVTGVPTCTRYYSTGITLIQHPQWPRTLVPPGPQLVSLRGFADLPAHSELTMPSLSPTMSQGNIVEWKKKEGDELASGDILCMVETDKATLEWENQDDGFLAKILVGDNSKDIPVGTPVAVITDEKDDVAAFADYSSSSGGGGGGGDGATADSPKEQKPSEPAADPESNEANPGSGGAADSGGGGGGGGGDWPPHSVMGLPSLSPTMSQGNIASWKKKEGEQVGAGDEMAEIETDKATMAWESQDDGFIAKILLQEGAKDIPVGTPAMIFVEEEEDIAAFKDYTAEDAKGGGAPKKPAAKPEAKKESKQETAPQQQPQQQEQKPAPSQPKQPSGGRVIASPYAKKLAREANVDISQATATGPEGRIVAADVQKLISEGGGKAKPQKAEKAAAPGPEQSGQITSAQSDDYSDIPNSQIRRITAKRLLESKQTVPHYYLTIDCRVDKLVQLRQQLNAGLAKDGKKLSVNDFVIKASAQAKEGKLGPAEMAGGTFTISNLGMYNVDNFSAVINPPQAAILAVGGSSKRVVVGSSGEFEEGTMMSVTLSCDHRVVDGAMGAQWLQAFRGYIEDPVSMLL